MSTLHLDIKTGDPDNLWTIALMSTHPRVDLQAVTVFPGRMDQNVFLQTKETKPDNST